MSPFNKNHHIPRHCSESDLKNVPYLINERLLKLIFDVGEGKFKKTQKWRG